MEGIDKLRGIFRKAEMGELEKMDNLGKTCRSKMVHPSRPQNHFFTFQILVKFLKLSSCAHHQNPFIDI